MEILRRTPGICLVLLLAARAGAQGAGKTKELHDESGRFRITVPAGWQEQPPAGTTVIRVQAPGGAGGHQLQVVVEAGQSDVDKQRDRYIAYDTGRFAGAEVSRFTKPLFGYRLDAPAADRVLVRVFLSDGSDGVVVSVQSRHRYYDRFHAKKILDILGTIRVAGASKSHGPAAAGGPKRRLFDERAQVSLVAAAQWKRRDPDDENVLIRLALHGRDSEPQFRLIDRGGPTNANLVIAGLAREWKQSYTGLTLKKFPGLPPRLMVKDRKPGWIDYVTAFQAGERGYALILAVREGGFEKYRGVADRIAASVVFANAPYREPQELPGDLALAHRKTAVIHAAAEEATAARRIADALGGFDAGWKRIGVGWTRKAPPLHVVLVDDDAFQEASDRFGERPIAWNPRRCAVVCTRPPADKRMRAAWRGRLYAALAQAALHRDLGAKAPPWLRAGLAACMDAAGRTGKKPDARHPALAPQLDQMVSAKDAPDLPDVLAYTDADFVFAETETKRAVTWGYVHLMNFGKGTLPGLYKRWVRLLAKAGRKAPPFDLKRYTTALDDLKKHVERELAE